MKVLFALLTCIAFLNAANGGVEQHFPECFHSHASLHAIPAQAIGSETDDLNLVKRIIETYKRAAYKPKNAENSMWQLFFNERHIPIHETLLKDQVDAVANILRNPSSSDIFFGFDSLAAFYAFDFKNAFTQESYAKLCLDGLARLAEVIGAVDMNDSKPYQLTTFFKKSSKLFQNFHHFQIPILMNMEFFHLKELFLIVFPNPCIKHGVYLNC